MSGLCPETYVPGARGRHRAFSGHPSTAADRRSAGTPIDYARSLRGRRTERHLWELTGTSAIRHPQNGTQSVMTVATSVGSRGGVS